MGRPTAIKHPVPDRVKPFLFVIFDILALWRLGLIVGLSGCQKLQIKNGLTRSGTGRFIWHTHTHMAAVGVKGLTH